MFGPAQAAVAARRRRLARERLIPKEKDDMACGRRRHSLDAADDKKI